MGSLRATRTKPLYPCGFPHFSPTRTGRARVPRVSARRVRGLITTSRGAGRATRAVQKFRNVST